MGFSSSVGEDGRIYFSMERGRNGDNGGAKSGERICAGVKDVDVEVDSREGFSTEMLGIVSSKSNNSSSTEIPGSMDCIELLRVERSEGSDVISSDGGS